MPPYNSSNLQAGIGRDVFYPALGFSLSELTGNAVYRDGAAATPTNADGTPYGAIPYANSRLGTGSVPDLTYPAPTAMQDSAYTAGYGRGVIFARSAQHRADPLAACDQWWDFGNNPALAGSSTYSVRQPTLPTSAFPLNDGNLDDPFAHYAGREIVAGMLRADWFYYTFEANPEVFYVKDNPNRAALNQATFGAAAVSTWNFVNSKLWDDTPGQQAWFEALNQPYKPCFSGGTEVPIGDWLPPMIGNKVHTINPDNSALVTVSGVSDPDFPYLSWSFKGSGINTVEVVYSTDGGSSWTTLPTTPAGNATYTATIPPVASGTVYYYARAKDNFANWASFPAGAETWNSSGLSEGRSIAAAQNYVISVPTASLGDVVWDDQDGDGVQDGDESGIAGVTVNLYAADGTPVASTTIDANGL